MTPGGPVLLFDLDGTLTDSHTGIVRCMRYALDRLSVSYPPDDVLASYIGPPIRGTFARLIGTSDQAVVEEAMRLYRERYETTGLYENTVYDGIPEVLDRAGRAANVMFVATSKPAIYARRVVGHFGLDRHFSKVYGPELDGRFDDKAELLAHLLKAEGVEAGGALMIGDTATDVRAAKLNGLRAIGVLWGYGTEAAIRGAGADAVCRTPAELTGVLGRT